MSEIHNSQGPDFSGNPLQGQDNQKEKQPHGISFQGEKTDLRRDPNAFVNKTLINKNKYPIKTKIGDQIIEFGSKQIEAVKKDLEYLYENPIAVQRAVALAPAFHSYAEKKGFKNPDAVALALEHYAATNEFVKEPLDT